MRLQLNVRLCQSNFLFWIHVWLPDPPDSLPQKIGVPRMSTPSRSRNVTSCCKGRCVSFVQHIGGILGEGESISCARMKGWPHPLTLIRMLHYNSLTRELNNRSVTKPLKVLQHNKSPQRPYEGGQRLAKCFGYIGAQPRCLVTGERVQWRSVAA